jgi:hypothetical protein
LLAAADAWHAASAGAVRLAAACRTDKVADALAALYGRIRPR